MVSNGTPGQTVQLQGIEPGPRSSSPEGFVRAGNTIYFQATTLETGTEIWGIAAADAAPPGNGRATGDFDNSGCTDIEDFLFLLDYWLVVSPAGGEEIGIGDFLALLDNWMTGPGC